MKAHKQTVFVAGSVVGYQFNKKSMGSRTFHLKVDTERGMVYVPFLQREVRVRRFHGLEWLWEAY